MSTMHGHLGAAGPLDRAAAAADKQPTPLPMGPGWAAQPVYGWRAWLVRSGRLHSLEHAVTWPPHAAVRASCLPRAKRSRLARAWAGAFGDRRREPGCESSPSVACQCGVHGTDSLLRVVDAGTADPRGPVVFGLVCGWGRVVADGDGWRAQYGQPVALLKAAEAPFDPRHGRPGSPDDPLRAVSRSYGLPIIASSGAAEWLLLARSA